MIQKREVSFQLIEVINRADSSINLQLRGSAAFPNSTNRMLNYNLYNDTKSFAFLIHQRAENYDNILKAGSLYNDTFLTTRSNYNVALYKIGNQSPFIDACVIYTGGNYGPSVSSKCYLVNEFYTSLNKNLQRQCCFCSGYRLTTKKACRLKIEPNPYFNLME